MEANVFVKASCHEFKGRQSIRTGSGNKSCSTREGIRSKKTWPIHRPPHTFKECAEEWSACWYLYVRSVPGTDTHTQGLEMERGAPAVAGNFACFSAYISAKSSSSSNMSASLIMSVSLRGVIWGRPPLLLPNGWATEKGLELALRLAVKLVLLVLENWVFLDMAIVIRWI